MVTRTLPCEKSPSDAGATLGAPATTAGIAVPLVSSSHEAFFAKMHRILVLVARQVSVKRSCGILILAGTLTLSCGGTAPDSTSEIVSRDQSPAFSPDGQSIAYIHNDYSNGSIGSYPSGIYTLDLASRRVVARYLGFARTVDWSRDGHKLIFDDFAGIHTLDTTTSVRELLFSGEAYFPSCASHGDTIAFDNLSAIGFVPLTLGTPVFPPSLTASRDPSWSPDGGKLAVRHPFPGASDEELGIITRQTGAIVRITHNLYPDRYPAWSHDGTRLAWLALTPGLAGPQLAVASHDGANASYLAGADGAPDWAPDDLTIAFPRYEGDKTRIYTIGLSSGALTPVSP